MNPLIDIIMGVANPLLDRFFPDKSKAQEFMAEFQTKLLDAQVQLDTAQSDVNKVEAASEDGFTRRWRPFIGWVCGSAFAINFVVIPMLAALSALAGSPLSLPPLDISEMMPVLLGMLGLGSLRTFEKVSGFAGGKK